MLQQGRTEEKCYEMFITFERNLIVSNESCFECKQIEFLRFLNSYDLLQLTYYSKVRFTREIELILPKCANILRTSGRNVVLTMLFSWNEKDTR